MEGKDRLGFLVCAAQKKFDLDIALTGITSKDQAGEAADGRGAHPDVDLFPVSRPGSFQVAVIERIDDLRMGGVGSSSRPVHNNSFVKDEPVEEVPKIVVHETVNLLVLWIGASSAGSVPRASADELNHCFAIFVKKIAVHFDLGIVHVAEHIPM